MTDIMDALSAEENLCQLWMLYTSKVCTHWRRVPEAGKSALSGGGGAGRDRPGAGLFTSK